MSDLELEHVRYVATYSNPALVGAQTWTEESLKATDASRYTIPEALMTLRKNKKYICAGT
jgi:hypothetical protein